MTAHELARQLLTLPDIPVVINGNGSDEGFDYEVTEAFQAVEPLTFSGANDTKDTPRDEMGYNNPRPCIMFDHCDMTPLSDAQIEKEKAVERKMEADRKHLKPETFALFYPTITPLTPDDIVAMCDQETNLNPQRNNP